MSQTDAHLLIVDDDERIRLLLGRFLRKNGFLVTQARDAAQARRLLTSAQGQARRQLHALPRQRARGHHGHHFTAGAPGLGQQRGRSGGMLQGSVAVRRQRVAVLGGGARAGGRQ